MSQISGIGIDQQVSGGGSANRFNELSSDDFLQIIFAELTNQDPLEPQDTGALLEQLNSIRQIESDLQLQQSLEALVTENQLASAGNLIGKYVEGRGEVFDEAAGFVISVAKEGDSVMLELDDGTRIPMGNVSKIVDPAIFGGP